MPRDLSPQPDPLNAYQCHWRALVHRQFCRLRYGQLTVVDGNGSARFGGAEAGGQAALTVHNPRCYQRVVLGGALGAAESFIDGDWHTPELTKVLRLFTTNLHVTDGMNQGLSRVRNLAAQVLHRFRRNSVRGSKRNILAHYDLGNDFFRLFLDSTMSYSCGIFESSSATLQEASVAKLDRVCRKLNLHQNDHLLEIGTGWGGLALYAAQNYGCRVTTTTISDQQYDYTTKAIANAGLSDRVTVLNQDYRALDGQFDKLVSIEMIEAVGPQYYETFFQKCRSLLKESGLALLQAIVIADERYRAHLKQVDFIGRYIFPGGGLPSTSVLTMAAAQGGSFKLLHLEEIGRHYEKTLRCWRDVFLGKLDEVRALGLDDRFIRMWDYYLSYCEAGFAERQIGNVQVLLGGRSCTLDPLNNFRIVARNSLAAETVPTHHCNGRHPSTPTMATAQLKHTVPGGVQ